MIRNNNSAAMPVRKATTAKGENLSGPMAAFPKTGANPRKKADTSAALIPAIRPFCMRIIALKNIWTRRFMRTTGLVCYLKQIPSLRMYSPCPIECCFDQRLGAVMYLFDALPSILLNQRPNFIQEFVVEEIALGHQGLNLTLQAALFIHSEFFGGRHDHRDVGGFGFTA